jgi:hypothetical protein
LSILRYLTVCLSLILCIGGNLKIRSCWRFCAGDSGSPARRLRCAHAGDFGQGPETPAQASGVGFRRVSLAPDMGAETLPGFFGWCSPPARRLRPWRLTPETPGSGPRRLRPKRTATASPCLGLYKAFFHLKSRLRLTLSHLHCFKASKLKISLPSQ